MTVHESTLADRKRAYRNLESPQEKIISLAVKKGFPHCKGTYPDCPEKPTKEHPTCRACPVLEEIMEKE